MKKISLALIVAILMTSVFNLASFAATTTLVKANEDYINVRTGPGTSYTAIGKANTGNTFAYLGSAKDSANTTWYKIQFTSTKVGYIVSTYSSLITQTTPDPPAGYAGKLTVTASPTLNVRSTPSTTAAILGKLNYGTVVDYYSLASGWYKINYGGKVAYISASYAKVVSTTPTPPPAPEPTPSLAGKVVTTADPTLNVRAATSTTSTILGKLNLGTTVGYYSLANGWYKIDYNGKIAYISASYAKIAPTTPPSPPPAPTVIGKLITTASPTLNVRSAASTSATILGKLNFGTTVNYYSLANGWYKIDYNGKIAYISASYANVISTTPPTPPEPVNTVPLGILLVNADPTLNVRAAASTGSSILGTLKFGTMIPYYEILSGWYRINFNSKSAYLSATYVKPVAKAATLKMTSSQASSVVGAPVTLTASANGFATPQYKYSVLEGTTWTTLSDFTTSSSIKYTPNSAGTKQFKLEVRETGGTAIDAQYTLDTTFNWGEVTAVNIATTPAGTGFIKQPLRLSAQATATGQTLYQFSVVKDGTETIVRDFSVHAQFDWKPLAAGVYTAKVTIKDSLNPSGKSITASVPVTIVIPKITSVSVEEKTYYIGRANTVRISSIGSPAPVYEVSVLAPSGASTKLTAGFVTNAELIWTPAEAGTHRIVVSARDENGSVVDVKREVTANVVVPVASSAQLTLYPANGQFKLQEPVTFQASAVGSPDLQYRFTVKDANGQPVHNQPYGDDDYLLWTTSSAGNYTVQVDIKDAYSAKDYETTTTLAFTIENVQGSAHYYTIQYVGISLDQAVAEQDTVEGTTARSSTYDPILKKWVRASAAQIREEMDPTKILQFEYRKAAESLGSVQVTINGLNVRTEASSSATVLGTVNKGETFEVLDRSSGWYQIHYDGKLGWISGTYVTFNAQAPKFYPVGTLIQVNTDILRIRSIASTTGTVLGDALKGENYVVLEDSGTGWYKIKRDSVIGWVSGYYVNNNVRTNTYTDITRAIPQQMFQFLDLRNHSGISLTDLNKILTGKGILEGQGQAFIDGSVANNVNEIYLVSHAILETGNGKSSLAMGYYYNPTTDHILPTGSEAQEGYVKVYNMYGIGAYDADPVGGGVRTAYKNGWTSPALAIQGGAVWVSKNYVNNTQYNQFTLYKMKWNHEYISHQYATDIGWARKQTTSMANMYSMVSNYSFRFVIPQYQ